jgi:hypothetical protein
VHDADGITVGELEDGRRRIAGDGTADLDDERAHVR